MTDEGASEEAPSTSEVQTQENNEETEPVQRGILKRSESTEETAQRRSSMKPSESLDAATRHEGILRRKRSCLQKTVSFSATVSEQLIPPKASLGIKKDEGEYVETNMQRQKADESPKLREQPANTNTVMAESVKKVEPRAVQAKEEKRSTPEAKKKEMAAKEEYKPLTVEDLPMDEDPDEFGISGVYKCGYCTVGFAPVKKKKMMFVTLSERALELHESEKSYRSGKAAKHMVDLAISFNVHGDHFDAKLKKCLCLMGPDETICMRPEGGLLTIEGWRRALVKGIHDSRRRKMDRTPRPEDIFDAVYDIRVCPSMKNTEKYNASKKEHGFTNIGEVCADLMGKKRLCLYPNTLAIVDLCIEPTPYNLPPAGFPPFRASNMFILERSKVAFYGFRENYFYIRIGKGCSFRGFEILFQVDSPEVCKEIYSRLQILIDRDIETRRLDSMRRPDSTINVSELHNMESLSVPSPLAHRNKLSLDSPVIAARDRRLLLGRDCLSFASIEKDDSAPSSPFANYNRPRGSLGNFQVDHLSRFDQPRGSIHSLGNLPVDRPRVPTVTTIKLVKEEPGLREALLETYPHLRKKTSTASERGELISRLEQERRMSDNRPRRKHSGKPDSLEIVDKNETKEPVKPKMPPLKLNANKPSGEFLLSLQREKERMEAARRNGYDGRTHNPDGSLYQMKKDFLDTVCPRPEPPEMVIPTRIINTETYTLMGPADWGKLEDLKKEEHSDSGDSCYSSQKGSASRQDHLRSQMQSRAQSFGSKQMTRLAPNRLPPTVNLPNSERKISAAAAEEAASSSNQLNLPQEDPRKRAFSLGSRNFFNLIGLNDFRRLVSKRHRTTSPHQTSTSGISLNSSTASPSSGSINFITSMDRLSNGRSASFGSGKHNSTKKENKKKSEENLVAIDFAQIEENQTAAANQAKSYPFGGAPAGSAAGEYDRKWKEREEQERKEREKIALELKRKEREEREKKEQDKEKEFRPKADSGIADCTPSSSFSGKKDEVNYSGDYVYADAEGLRFMADIKKRKKENNEKQKSVTSDTNSLCSTTSVATNEDRKSITSNVEQVTKSMTLVEVNVNRKFSITGDLNRKPSICAAIVEEKEEQSETDSRGEPSDRKNSIAPPTTSRKPSTTSSSSSLSPFKRLKFLSFRK